MAKDKIAPLSASFTLASIIGFILSLVYIMDWDTTWGFAFALIFFCMFLASMQSMRYANPDAQLKMR